MRELILLFCLAFASIYKPIQGSSGANCPVKTRNRGCCVFPFVYKGVTYNQCIKGHSVWCSQTPNYDKDGKWDYCVGLEGKITADDKAWVYGNGQYMGNDNDRWNVIKSYMFGTDIEVVAILVKNTGGPSGLMATFSNGIRTDSSWKCTTTTYKNWHTTNFDDSSWPHAVEHALNGYTVRDIPRDVRWIGVRDPNAKQFYCRRRISVKPQLPPSSPACNEALGLESGWIENSAVTASSNWDAQHMAWRARLNIEKQGSFTGGWSARTNNVNQWIQVDFGRSTRVTAVATQGRQDSDQWVTRYTLSYGNNPNDLSSYRVNGYTKQFNGNTNRNTVVKHTLSPAAEGRYIRLHPKAWKGHISMRMEFYGCYMACKVDIGILMDESGSVSPEDWVREKNFVKDLSDHFEFGQKAAQIGVISFSTRANMDIQLNSNNNGNSFKKAVDRIRQARGWTYTATALNLAYNQLFHSSKGARSNVAKVLIVITDGFTTSGKESLRAPTKRLKDSSVNIISIGVGSKINKAELELMATTPINSHVFYVTQMEQLKDLISSITTSSCSSFTCRYVTCDYGTWGAWSKSCGQGMTRIRKLSKTNWHTTEKQGGCAGMKQTCDAQVTETKNDNCPCRYVSCSWNQWGAWSATCGKMTRIRTSKVTQHTVTRPNCDGLQTTCPSPESKSIYISCCKAEVGIMLDESGSVIDEDFKREKDFVNAMANGFGNYGPDGIQMGVITFSTGAAVDIKLNQYRNKQDFVNAVNRIVQFRGWTYTNKALDLARTHLFKPGNGVRKGVTKVLVIITDGVSTPGIASLKEPVRLLKESHVNIFTIGIGRRINKRELDLMASLPTESHVFQVASMSELPKLLQRISDSSCQAFTCKYVTCDYAPWSAWSASCGKGMRRTQRLVKVNQHTKQQQGGCSGLQTTCEATKTESKDMKCQCRYVECSWKPWGEWSATCGTATRRRESLVTVHVTDRLSCSGLQTTCPAPEVVTRTTNCPCKGISCTWNVWSMWSATCGRAQRRRTIKSTPIIQNLPDCSKVPQTCSQRPEIETRTTNCVCAYVECVWNPYSAWSATCGVVTRTRTIKTIRKTINKPDCSGLKQECTEKPQTERREVKCTCKFVKCTQNPWTDWSATCGKATRQRTWKTTQVTEDRLNCDNLPQSCPTKPEVESRETMCSCKTVDCVPGAWGDWSNDCGDVTRRRNITETAKVVQQLSCHGLPQKCANTFEEENKTLPDACQECFTVLCYYSAWQPWSATCGPATRRRYQIIDEIEVLRKSCEKLPLECTGDQQQTQTRDTPPCPTTPTPKP
ncbi:uncharacterized protein LOC116308348 isoform X2 [Actinia tenebrosa]|uniref:Uncharacterized protein LOC116308348 isoform X2 n=1 Tax=Actinia tenebrosa TaxID=6105 RepID=A0A6P8JA45_ACTTE|nr:uncharacterized protein LOC116308348 isoform X2 [Actinia tenebrosa]